MESERCYGKGTKVSVDEVGEVGAFRVCSVTGSIECFLKGRWKVKRFRRVQISGLWPGAGNGCLRSRELCFVSNVVWIELLCDGLDDTDAALEC